MERSISLVILVPLENSSVLILDISPLFTSLPLTGLFTCKQKTILVISLPDISPPVSVISVQQLLRCNIHWYSLNRLKKGFICVPPVFVVMRRLHTITSVLRVLLRCMVVSSYLLSAHYHTFFFHTAYKSHPQHYFLLKCFTLYNPFAIRILRRVLNALCIISILV